MGVIPYKATDLTKPKKGLDALSLSKPVLSPFRRTFNVSAKDKFQSDSIICRQRARLSIFVGRRVVDNWDRCCGA